MLNSWLGLASAVAIATAGCLLRNPARPPHGNAGGAVAINQPLVPGGEPSETAAVDEFDRLLAGLTSSKKLYTVAAGPWLLVAGCLLVAAAAWLAGAALPPGVVYKPGGPRPECGGCYCTPQHPESAVAVTSNGARPSDSDSYSRAPPPSQNRLGTLQPRGIWPCTRPYATRYSTYGTLSPV